MKRQPPSGPIWARIDTTIQALRALQNHLGNSCGLHEAETRHDAFLNWCENPARPQMEHLVASAEELLDELNSAYSRVAVALPTPARPVPAARRPAAYLNNMRTSHPTSATAEAPRIPTRYASRLRRRMLTGSRPYRALVARETVVNNVIALVGYAIQHHPHLAAS